MGAGDKTTSEKKKTSTKDKIKKRLSIRSINFLKRKKKEDKEEKEEANETKEEIPEEKVEEKEEEKKEADDKEAEVKEEKPTEEVAAPVEDRKGKCRNERTGYGSSTCSSAGKGRIDLYYKKN